MTEPRRDQGLRLDNPLVVQWEYASEERLAQRNRAYRELLEGVNAEDVAFQAVAEVEPERVLDVGCGTGEFVERIKNDLGAAVCGVDLSPRMVALTAARGVDTRIGDVQKLEFEDGAFECVVANWLLYHVAEPDAAAREIARVLRPGGRLVAATLARSNLADLWTFLGDEGTRDLVFDDETGAAVLEPHFARVERREAAGTIVFHDRETMRQFVAVTIDHAHLADRVPELTEPFRAGTRHVVFVAHK